MGDVVVTFTNVAAYGLPDADREMGGGSSDPYVVFAIRLGGVTYSERTSTIKNGRNVKWVEEVKVTVPRSTNVRDVNGAQLRVTVWDQDDGDADDPIGSCTEIIDSHGRGKEKRILNGVGKLYCFEVSFAYSVLFLKHSRVRACQWIPPVMPHAQNIKVSDCRGSITRLVYRGAAAGTSVATSTPMLAGEQDAVISFRVSHPDAGRHMMVGVVSAAVSAANMAVRGFYLSVYSGRCFTGMSADYPSHMLSGQLDATCCKFIEQQLIEEGGVLIRMRVNMATRKLYFDVGDPSGWSARAHKPYTSLISIPRTAFLCFPRVLPACLCERSPGAGACSQPATTVEHHGGSRVPKWFDAGADLPSQVRPCVILGDDEGACITLLDKVIFTAKVGEGEKEEGASESHWAKLAGSICD